MNRREFVKTAGIAALATTGVTGVANAYCKTINGFISWNEVARVVRDYGFTREDLVFPINTARDEFIQYRKHMKGNEFYSLVFTRLADFKGRKYTYVKMEKHIESGSTSDGKLMGMTLIPLQRGLLDPREWESELRSVIYTSFVMGNDAE